MRALWAISVIVMVAGIMVMSSLVPAILPQAEAHTNKVKLSDGICDAIKKRYDGKDNMPLRFEHLLLKHC